VNDVPDRAAQEEASRWFLRGLGVEAAATVLVSLREVPPSERRTFYDDAARTRRAPIMVTTSIDPELLSWCDGAGVALFCTTRSGRFEPISIEAGELLLSAAGGPPARADWRLRAIVHLVDRAIAERWRACVRWSSIDDRPDGAWFEVRVGAQVTLAFGGLPPTRAPDADVVEVRDGNHAVAVLTDVLRETGYTLDHFVPGPLLH
jgi:hypothetical protein